MKKYILFLVVLLSIYIYVISQLFLSNNFKPEKIELQENELYINGRLYFIANICVEYDCIDTVRGYYEYQPGRKHNRYKYKYGPKTDCYCEKMELDTILLE